MGLLQRVLALNALLAVLCACGAASRPIRGLQGQEQTADVAVALHDSQQARAAGRPDNKEPQRQFKADKVAKGHAQLKLLEETDPEKFARLVAKYDGDGGRLKQDMRRDNDLAIDLESEEFLYVCEGLVFQPELAPSANSLVDNTDGVAAAAATVKSAFADTTEPDSSKAFLLHSRPGSTRVMYLDFTGHTAVGTAWGPSITTPPYSIDSDPAFSLAELRNIVSIWRSVAEDYASFDVDVTTEYPGSESLISMRAAIGGSCYDWYIKPGNPGAGGVAYVGGWGDPNLSPAFVFPAQLGNGEPKYVAESVSHEIGHTLGLHHDGLTNSATGTTTEYYGGVDGSNWAPIMGVSFYKNITQWSSGEYAGANNQENDLTLIRTKLPALAIQHNITLATAAEMDISSSTTTTRSSNVRGTIDTSSAKDMYKIIANTDGLLTATVLTTPSGANSNGMPFARSNLDVNLVLISASGLSISYQDPSSAVIPFPGDGSLGATLSTQVTAGTYYLKVQSSQNGAVKPAGGYTTDFGSYGTMGQYTLQATWPWLRPVTVNITAVTVVKSLSTWYATATVQNYDALNTTIPVKGVSMTGRWDYLYTNGTSVVLNSTVSFSTPSTSWQVKPGSPGVNAPGTFTFTVTAVTTPTLLWTGGPVSGSVVAA